jgi:hypothetical protein
MQKIALIILCNIIISKVAVCSLFTVRFAYHAIDTAFIRSQVLRDTTRYHSKWRLIHYAISIGDSGATVRVCYRRKDCRPSIHKPGHTPPAASGPCFCHMAYVFTNSGECLRSIRVDSLPNVMLQGSSFVLRCFAKKYRSYSKEPIKFYL